VKNKVEFNVNDWVYKPGIPKNAAIIVSDKFQKVEEAITNWEKGTLNETELCKKDWNIQQKIHFIRNIPKEISIEKFTALDNACQFSTATNSYIAMVWFEQAINHDYHANNVDAQIENFLMTVGRRWYVSTLYKAFKRNDKLEEATRIYKKARPNYHSVTVNTIDDMLGVSN
jgi:hypothetical protein